MPLFTLQVTLGAAATRVQTASLPCRQVTVQNNSNDTCRVGDKNVTATRGAKLDPSSSGLAGGSYNSMLPMGAVDLNEVWIFGTIGDIIDIIYVV